jgi:hypothetical protein
MAESFLNWSICERQALLCRQNSRGFQENELPRGVDPKPPGQHAAGDEWICLWPVDLPPWFGQKFAPNRRPRRID